MRTTHLSLAVVVLGALLAPGCVSWPRIEDGSSAAALAREFRARGIDTFVVSSWTSMYARTLGLDAIWIEEGEVRTVTLDPDRPGVELARDRLVIDYVDAAASRIASARYPAPRAVFDSASGLWLVRLSVSASIDQEVAIGLGGMNLPDSGIWYMPNWESPVEEHTALRPVSIAAAILESGILIDTLEIISSESAHDRSSGARSIAALRDSLLSVGIDTLLEYTMLYYDWEVRAWQTAGMVQWKRSDGAPVVIVASGGEQYFTGVSIGGIVDGSLADSLDAEEYIVEPALFDTTLTPDRVPPHRAAEAGDATVTIHLGRRVLTKHRPSWSVRENAVSRAYLANVSSPLHAWMMSLDAAVFGSGSYSYLSSPSRWRARMKGIR